MTDITREQAATLLLSRQESTGSLIQFARYIPIPSVPIQDTGQAYELVETPLADHHLLILECLQAMTDHHLRYQYVNGQLYPIEFSNLQPDQPASQTALPYPALPYPAAETPHGGRFDGGVCADNEYPHLSRFYKSIPRPNSSKGNASAKVVDSTEKNIEKFIESAKNIGDISHISSKKVASEVTHRLGIENNKIEVCHRVMLMLPPGSAKSTYASVVFPSWEMGRNPHAEIILTGYGDVICKKHGKRARQLCSSPAYQNVFGCTLSPDTRAADEWELTNRSSYKASGILSGITGFRCDGLIWDDLTKGRKEADSVGIRNDTYNAYLDDARSRKKPTAWEVGIGTRWHEDEIMGRILPEGFAGESGFMECRDGNVWFVICIPAQAERADDPLGREIGEYIWKEWFHEGYWVDKKINPRTWGSLYQQRPAPEEGIYFKQDWNKTYTTLPENLNHYIAFDPAVSEEEDADDTCIQAWGVDHLARIYLIDEWLGKVTMDVWITILLDWVKRFKPLEVISESGVIRRAAEPYIQKEMRIRKIFAVLEWVSRTADKSAMARSMQAMMSAGQLYLPENSVGDKNLDEYLRFPAGKNDHRVDSGANLCLRLEKIWETTPPVVEKEKSSIITGGGIPIKSLMPSRHSKKESIWKLN